MSLTDTEIKKAKPSTKDYQMGDGDGLSLVIRKKGTKTWRYEFRLKGKKDKYHYGNYPQISLVNARKIHAVARELITFDRHPSSLLDNPGAIQMIIDGFSIKEIEAKVAATKEAEAIQALITFGDAPGKYKTEWVDMKWKNPDKGWRPVVLHLLPKLKDSCRRPDRVIVAEHKRVSTWRWGTR